MDTVEMEVLEKAEAMHGVSDDRQGYDSRA
jgi:hypothetical protein